MKISFLHEVNVLRGDTHPAHLTQLGEHHNDGGIVFPEHPPEVFGGLCQGPLSSDVGFLLSGLQRTKRACERNQKTFKGSHWLCKHQIQ